jgi:hypothetical protein
MTLLGASFVGYRTGNIKLTGQNNSEKQFFELLKENWR